MRLSRLLLRRSSSRLLLTTTSRGGSSSSSSSSSSSASAASASSAPKAAPKPPKKGPSPTVAKSQAAVQRQQRKGGKASVTPAQRRYAAQQKRRPSPAAAQHRRPSAAGKQQQHRRPTAAQRQQGDGNPGRDARERKRSLMPYTVDQLASLSIADVNSRLMAALRSRTVQTPTSIHAIFALWSALLDVHEQRLGRMKPTMPEKQLNALRPSTITFNLMLKACFLSPSDRLDQVVSLNEMMIETGTKRTEVTFSESIKCCSRKGAHKQAFAFLAEMEKQGMEADAVVHHFIITTCARSGAFNAAEKHLRGALQMGAQQAAEPEATTTEAAEEDAAAAKKAPSKGRRRGGAKLPSAAAMLAPRPTSDMFTVIIAEALRLARPPSLAMRFVDMAVNEADVVPTSSVVIEVLMAAIDVDDLDTAAAAFAVLRRPKSSATVLDKGVYLTMHNGAARTGNFALSDAVCDAVLEQGDALDEDHFRAKLYTHCTLPGADDSTTRVFQTLFDMATHGVVPSAAICSVVARRLALSSASIDGAFYALQSVRRAEAANATSASAAAGAAVVADHSALALLEACCELRDTDRAFATMNDWEKISPAPPSAVAYNLLLRACVDGPAAAGSGDMQLSLSSSTAAAPLDLVREVARMMEHNEVKADNHTLEALALGFVRSRMMDAANEAVDDLLAAGEEEVPSPSLLEIVVRRNARDGNDARVAVLLEEMKKRNLFISTRLKQFVVDFASEPPPIPAVLQEEKQQEM